MRSMLPPAPPIRRVPRYVVGLFFGVLLALGGLLVADYGISWDEPNDRQNGLVNLRYVADRLAPGWADQYPALREQPPLAGYHDNDHGVLFELPLAWLDVQYAGPTGPRAYYLLRHAATFLLSLGGVWALFRLGTWRFRDERLGH
jgi:hypothetical protein